MPHLHSPYSSVLTIFNTLGQISSLNSLRLGKVAQIMFALSNYSLIQISSCCPATSFVSFSMKVFKPVKICLKNGYSEEQIHWVLLIHFSFSIFFFFSP